MVIVHMCYLENPVDVTEDQVERAQDTQDRESRERKFKGIRSMWVDTFESHCDSSVHKLRGNLLDQILELIGIFGALSVLDGKPYEHFNMHSKKMRKEAFERRERNSENCKRDEELLQALSNEKRR